MSIQFAKDEAVVRRYDYATLGFKKKLGRYTTFKSLIVTNKRVIHEAVCGKRGSGMVVRREMPIEDAKYVDTAVSRTSKPAFIVWAVIFAILGAVGFVLPTLNVLPNLELVFQGVGAGACLIAVLFLIAYFGSRKAFLLCNISTDHDLYHVMGITEVEDHSKTDDKKKKKSKKNKSLRLEIAINTAVAKQLSDELGAVILEAKAYEPMEEVEEIAEEAEASVEEAEEESVEDAAVAVEEAVEAEEVAETTAE